MLNLPKVTVFLQLVYLNQIFMYGNDNYYCNSVFCNNSTEHVMCKFQFEGPARHCINYERTIKSEGDKRLILDKINSRRNKVAAGEIRSLRPAENMAKLDWNEELALFAQRWADQCVEHGIPDKADSCRDLENSLVNQNIATIYGDAPGLTPLSLVDLWYMGLLNINTTVISQYKRSMANGSDNYDYFTQLIWAETTEVGCGAVKFKEQVKELNNTKVLTVYRLVCNFAPAGNQVGQAVYADGLPCSRCPFGRSCDSEYTALCAPDASSTSQMELDDNPIKLRQYIRTKYLTVTESNIIPNISEKQIENWSMPEKITDYDDNNSYNFIPDFLKFTTQTSTFGVQNTTICKDVALVVDELYNLLKRKLSEDQTLRDFLFANKSTQNGITEEAFTDPSVAAIMSRIYSKKESPTTTKISDNEYLNSTLLVDLVENVIFRHNERMPTSEVTESNTQLNMEVNPVEIQAELGEIKLNSDFTGHYFFPEDSNDQTSSDKTENYYDTSDLPASDIAIEIEDLRRHKGTKDFIEEILDSDFITETLPPTNHDIYPSNEESSS